ncbi:TonB-dependent receptor [Sphingobium sp. CECT 9361]|uniref:TonB-dependent receptor n=1 Tax=Sphingobium sp. CECT 9361 TaxID=2845384 RepID=UPI001E4824A9|nr:TonB-dependent receptor [Sphingobium sp. CECT 9361]CAH0354276.1 Vitamin B12 transporter BtuB [Sphingobium sp. CECT 9361]
MMNSFRDSVTTMVVLFMAGASPAAMAQSENASSDLQNQDQGSPDIVVTAQKRSERLQDVPVSVSALAGDAIMKQRITQVDDIVTKIPNLQLTAAVGEGTPIFSLRGVSMSDFSLNQSGAVATYYDEVYKGNFAFLGVALYDLERVEVLRGPQGTLYGKNTTGGAINLISRKPVFKTEGYLSAGYGNFNRHEISGAINTPLTSTLAARVAFTFARADGWFKNQLPGQPDLQGVREYGIKGSLLWEPSAGVSFLLRASTSLQNPYNYGVYAVPGANGVGNGVYESFGQGSSYFRTGLKRREIESNETPRRRARTYAVSLTSNIDVGNDLSITSVTSYDKGTLNVGEDNDGGPVRTLEISYGDRAQQITQDLRLTSDWKGAFNFILGAYYNREKVFNTSTLGSYRDLDVNGDGALNAQDCADGLPLACNVTNRFDQLKHSYALYSDARLEFGAGFTLRGGLRFTHDDGRQSGLQSDAFGVDGTFVASLIPSSNRSFKTDNVSGKIGVDYKPSRSVLLYGNYSRGYRARSFNAQAFFDVSEVTIAKPETIDSFEAGAKTQFFDKRVTLNGAGFYYGYKNQQFINVNPQTSAQTLGNLEKSRVYGAELELTVRANDMVDLHAGLGLLSTRIKKGTLSGVDLKGNNLSNAPSTNMSAGLDFKAFDDGSSRLSFHPGISYVSSQYFEVLNISRLKQSGYALIDGHIDFERGPFTASIWGKNLTNKFYATARIDVSGFGFDYNHLGTPRTYGVSMNYKF